MTDRALRNIAASVHDRLLNRSRETGEDFQFLLQRYAAERFLYRLGKSPYRDRFVLKGAMLFALWGGTIYRATRDLDFTGYGDSETEAVLACFRDLCSLRVDDGVVFDASTLTAEPILDDAEYNGLRVRFQATLGSARIPMPVDVGFGNAIEPPAADVEYPVLLDGPAPWIRAYPHEAVVAEKLHAIHRFGEANSRFKDFYDLYVLSQQLRFDGERLAQAVAATFERRSTPIEAGLPPGLAPRFFSDDRRAEQWRAYLRRNGLPGAPADFDAVGERLRAFLGPVRSYLADGSAFTRRWQPGGGWGPQEPVAAGAVAFVAQAYRPPGDPATDATDPVATRPTPKPPAIGQRRFKPYPAYKNSGVEWLGKIPAHWRLVPVKRLIGFTTGWTPPTGEDRLYDGDNLWANISDLGPRRLHDTQKTISDEAVRQSGLKPSPPGSLLFAFKLSVGTASIATREMYTNEAIATFLPARDVDVEYLYWAAPIYIPQNAIENIYGAKLLNRKRIANAPLSAPPLPEQHAIAAFLDRETAKIDALVAKKEQLIGLLQEKRTALITRAVTKGLEGLDSVSSQMPSSAWMETRVGRVIKLQRGFDITGASEVSDGVPVISSGGLSGYSDNAIVEGPGVVVGRKGTLGTVYYVDCSYWPHDTTLWVKDFRGNLPRFVYYFLLHLRLERFDVGAANPTLNRNHVHPITIRWPDTATQLSIAGFLDRETANISALIAKVQAGIERLKEYRTALISAAVTGKIDVREEAA